MTRIREEEVPPLDNLTEIYKGQISFKCVWFFAVLMHLIVNGLASLWMMHQRKRQIVLQNRIFWMENHVYCCLLLKILLQTHSYSMTMAERNYRGEQWEMYCLLSADCFIDIVNLASYDTHCLNKLFICPSNGNQIILSHHCTTTLWP